MYSYRQCIASAHTVPVVQGTWALDAEGSIAYYSEVEDEEYHTTDIGVPNTETGTYV